MATEKKSAGLAAFLNVILPGIGYLYLGKRKTFGIVVLIGYALGWLSTFIFGAVEDADALYYFSNLLLIVAFGIDGYSQAKE